MGPERPKKLILMINDSNAHCQNQQHFRQLTILFGVVGFCAGAFSAVPVAKFVFYTTKPFPVINDWATLLYAAVFAAAGMITMQMVLHSCPFPRGRRLKQMLKLGIAGAFAFLAAAVAVAVSFARIHRSLNAVPSKLLIWLFIFIPCFALAAICLVAKFQKPVSRLLKSGE